MAFAALVVDLTAKLTNLQTGMDRAVKIAEDSSKKIEKAFSFGGAAKAGAGFFAAQVGLESARDALVTVKELSDEWTRTRVLIENVTSSLQEAEGAQRRLFEIAQATRQNYGELTRTFASFARNASEIGITTQQAVELQQTISQAIALSGARADSAASALVQFGQGIAAGVLRGEELNSVLEQTPKLAKAIADGMGVPLATLIKMGKEGELTAEKIIEALQKIAPKMQEEFDKVTPTIADSFTKLTNSFGNVIARIEEAAGPARMLSKFISDIADGIDKVVKFTRTDPVSVGVRAAADAERLVQEEEANLRGLRARPATPARDAGIPKAEQRLANARAQLQSANDALAALNVDKSGRLLEDAAKQAAVKAEKAATDRTKAAEEAGKLLARLQGISNSFDADVAKLVKARDAGALSEEAFQRAATELIKSAGFFPKKSSGGSGARPAEADPLAPLIRDGEKLIETFDRWRASILGTIDPTRELYDELDRITKLEGLGPEVGLSFEQAQSARADVEARLKDARDKFERSSSFVGPSIEVTENYRKAKESLDQYLESLRIEADLIGLTDSQREARVKLLDAEKAGLARNSKEWEDYREQIENALNQKRLAEIDQMRGGVSDSRTADILLLSQRLRDQIDEAAFFGGDITQFQEQYSAAVQAVLGNNQTLKDETYKLGEAFQSAFEQAVLGGDKFSDVLKGLARDVASLFLRQQFTAPLAEFVNASTKNAFSGSTIFDAALALFGGARAMGGDVTAGRTYLVGERGPELFTAGANGRITPNTALKNAAPVTNVYHYHIDSRTDRASIVSDIQRAQFASLAMQRDARARGNQSFA